MLNLSLSSPESNWSYENKLNLYIDTLRSSNKNILVVVKGPLDCILGCNNSRSKSHKKIYSQFRILWVYGCCPVFGKLYIVLNAICTFQLKLPKIQYPTIIISILCILHIINIKIQILKPNAISLIIQIDPGQTQLDTKQHSRLTVQLMEGQIENVTIRGTTC